MKRLFEDLILEIEHNGTKIVPIKEIVKLATNVNEEKIKYEAKYWINDGYDYGCWYRFHFEYFDERILVGVSRTFDISKRIGNNVVEVSNQFKIFKFLTELNFI
jgi:hypothetical protein